jgi:hypothetical protein
VILPPSRFVIDLTDPYSFCHQRSVTEYSSRVPRPRAVVRLPSSGDEAQDWLVFGYV